MGKIIVGKVLDIPTGNMSKISVFDNDILEADIGGNVFAFYYTCKHVGASLSEEVRRQ